MEDGEHQPEDAVASVAGYSTSIRRTPASATAEWCSADATEAGGFGVTEVGINPSAPLTKVP